MANKILPVADALKQLYQSLGGDDPEVLDMSTNTELIQEIAKVATSGGSGLPEVTEADNGRVLGVDDGEWKVVTPAGGSIACLIAQPIGFGNTSHILGFFGYFKQIDNKWTLISGPGDLYWFENEFVTSSSYGIPPASSGIKIFWAIYSPRLDDINLVLSGNISQTPITVYDNDNVSYNGYELTGSAFAEIIALG